MQIDQEGITYRTMDPSHVALIDVAYPNAMFEKYEVSKPGMFGIRTKELNQIVKTFDKKESVRVYVSDNLIHFETKSSSQTLRLIESSNVNCPLPKIFYNAMASIDLKTFKGIIKRLKMVSEYVTLNMHGQILEISTKGDNGQVSVKLEKGMENMPEFDLKEESQSTYSIEYVENFLKCLSCKLITLNFSTKMPIRLDAHDSNYSRINYYLAPRVES